MGNPNPPWPSRPHRSDTKKKGVVAVAAEGRPSEGLGENIRSIVIGRNAANINNAVSHVLSRTLR
eukprot:scaffold5590_cov120-Isochrysis_galbana.AAC.1